MPRVRSSKTSDEAKLNDMPFEAAFAAMQATIAQLEQGDLPLDNAIAAFENGMVLAQRCHQLLDAAQLRVQALESADGTSFTLIDIEVDA